MCVPCTWNGCTELAPRTEGSLIGAARAAASSTQSHTAGHSLPWRRTPKITFTQVACGAVWIWKEAEGRRYAEAWGAGLHTLMPTMQPARGCPGLVHVSHRLTFPGLGLAASQPAAAAPAAAATAASPTCCGPHPGSRRHSVVCASGQHCSESLTCHLHPG